jgi:soluble lytic murein transglycosylase-like protein
MKPFRISIGWAAAFALAFLGTAWPVLADGELYYYEEQGRIVITDTPSREDVRPVPGIKSEAAPNDDRLPTTPYDPFIERVAREYGLSPRLIKSVALVESGFNPRAVSHKGAQGLMQLMPATARRYGVRDPLDPLQNLRAGARHLRNLLDEFGGDLTLALAAYNAGSGAVRRHGGVPNYRETRNYVRKVHDSMGRELREARLESQPRQPPSDPVRLVRGSDGSLILVNQ